MKRSRVTRRVLVALDSKRLRHGFVVVAAVLGLMLAALVACTALVLAQPAPAASGTHRLVVASGIEPGFRNPARAARCPGPDTCGQACAGRVEDCARYDKDEP
jgi:hypothetical protein